MENFLIIINADKDKEFELTNQICDYLATLGKQCIRAAIDVKGHLLHNEIPKGVDCALVLGGDGTIIRAARELAELDIPILGFNLGTLGYLAEVEVSDFKKALNKLFLKRPAIEKRMMLQGCINGEMENSALNDIVISRDGSLRIVNFNVYVNGILLNNYMADGVVISTPTGSTAYNLSAGGPIVEPTASIIVLTPICSHALNTSSIVLSAEDSIEVEVCTDRYGQPERMAVTFDGYEPVAMATGDRIVIRKSSQVTKLVKLREESFLKIMQTKMKGN
ncbi:MAG: NAD(+)/NADH kinase [Lachnospiraceae bacterium]|nr:NAD(+)/NADH kinase [Lachnospiraceae bacterium]